MTDLNLFVESYRNEVGATAAEIPDATALAHLKDAFWDAWWDGYFRDYKIDGDEIVPIETTTAELEEGMARLVVLYAGYRRIRTRFLDFKTRVAQSAGRNAISNEVERSANLAVEVFKAWTARLQRLRDDLEAEGATSGTRAHFLNAVLIRDAQLYTGADVWVR